MTPPNLLPRLDDNFCLRKSPLLSSNVSNLPDHVRHLFQKAIRFTHTFTFLTY